MNDKWCHILETELHLAVMNILNQLFHLGSDVKYSRELFRPKTNQYQKTALTGNTNELNSNLQNPFTSYNAFAPYSIKRGKSANDPQVQTKPSISYCSVSPFQAPAILRQQEQTPVKCQTDMNQSLNMYQNECVPIIQRRTNYQRAVKHYIVRPQTASRFL